ncbi:hypothetical protein ACIP5Y_04165 [Nocardia sp. NPDC088792]|uniref:hypothetical protein n=1 Tax=Nocardia sp. NPDC088792 TaxID=3364332 RepID=UPI0037F9DB17
MLAAPWVARPSRPELLPELSRARSGRTAVVRLSISSVQYALSAWRRGNRGMSVYDPKVPDHDHAVLFEDLVATDLHIDRLYSGRSAAGRSRDPISRLLGLGVQGGIRVKGSPIRNSVRLVALYSTGRDPDWPDCLDVQTGILTYFGDNKRPGAELHDWSQGYEPAHIQA